MLASQYFTENKKQETYGDHSSGSARTKVALQNCIVQGCHNIPARNLTNMVIRHRKYSARSHIFMIFTTSCLLTLRNFVFSLTSFWASINFAGPPEPNSIWLKFVCAKRPSNEINTDYFFHFHILGCSSLRNFVIYSGPFSPSHFCRFPLKGTVQRDGSGRN